MNNLKTVTYEQFLTFNPCWLEDTKKSALLKRIASTRPAWTALDVLALEEVEAEDRLWAVLREEFLPAPLLNEFACRCAEGALALEENPDPRSVAAIAAKRKWSNGEISDEELAAARDAAGDALRVAVQDVAWTAARVAARVAARDAVGDAAWSTAWGAARVATRAAAGAAARNAAWDAAWDAAWKQQVANLTEMIHEWPEAGL